MGGGEMVGTLVAQQPQAQPGLLIGGIQRYNVGKGGLGISGAATLQQQAGQIEVELRAVRKFGHAGPQGGFRCLGAAPPRDPGLTEASAAGSLAGSVPPGLRHVRPPATLAAHLLGDEVDQFSGLELAGEIGGDAGDQADLAFATAGQHDSGALQLVLELVQRLAQGRGIGAFQARRAP
jgi:hypothetical protein